jgi:hypothetical protein
MGRNLDDVLAAMPKERRAKIAARAAEIMAEELSLRDLRKAMNRTQVAMARKLRMGQDGVSRLERRADMLISTLRDYVRALGGELHIVAEFPNRPPVRLTELGSIAERHPAQARSRPAKRAAV